MATAGTPGAASIIIGKPNGTEVSSDTNDLETFDEAAFEEAAARSKPVTAMVSIQEGKFTLESPGKTSSGRPSVPFPGPFTLVSSALFADRLNPDNIGPEHLREIATDGFDVYFCFDQGVVGPAAEGAVTIPVPIARLRVLPLPPALRSMIDKR